MKTIRLDLKKDFTLSWFSGTGAGGQHRNKHQNCLRLTHNESGIMVTSQSHRERQANLREAIEKIKPKIKEFYSPVKDDPRAKSTEVVRTYHEPDNRVKDHLSGEMGTYKDVVVNGNIDEMVDARRDAVIQRNLEK